MNSKFTKIEKVIAGIVAGLYVTTSAFAQTVEWTGVCVGGAEGDVATIQGLECLIANVFTVIISLIGLAAFVMLLVGAMRWLLSGGNSSNLDKAKNTMTYALIGIVVSLSAFIVLNLIAGFTGVQDIRKFEIPTSNSRN